MFRAAVVLSLASVLLAALALISCLSVENKREIRGLPRFAWVLLILLVPLAGPIAWFTVGRPRQASKPGSPWRSAGGLAPPRRPQAPDDDPDFLRSLDQRTGGPRHRSRSSQVGPETPDEEELLRKWEEDLSKREEEQRGGEAQNREEDLDRTDEERRGETRRIEEELKRREEERRRRDSGTDA